MKMWSLLSRRRCGHYFQVRFSESWNFPLLVRTGVLAVVIKTMRNTRSSLRFFILKDQFGSTPWIPNSRPLVPIAIRWRNVSSKALNFLKPPAHESINFPRRIGISLDCIKIREINHRRGRRTPRLKGEDVERRRSERRRKRKRRFKGRRLRRGLFADPFIFRSDPDGLSTSLVSFHASLPLRMYAVRWVPTYLPTRPRWKEPAVPAHWHCTTHLSWSKWMNISAAAALFFPAQSKTLLTNNEHLPLSACVWVWARIDREFFRERTCDRNNIEIGSSFTYANFPRVIRRRFCYTPRQKDSPGVLSLISQRHM